MGWPYNIPHPRLWNLVAPPSRDPSARLAPSTAGLAFPVPPPSSAILRLRPHRGPRQLLPDPGVVDRRTMSRAGKAGEIRGVSWTIGVWEEDRVCRPPFSLRVSLSGPSRRPHLHAPNPHRGVMARESETHDGGREVSVWLVSP
ncbi:hypothetical protein BDW42DRAFT_138295 [Aspergillus taichungensis]|uniref:Uncharacterized protein n=1 Tax=Aspergillus taichungensis TaxID=482145 RepID=A0A2J5HNQ6_9EURO|nr:hypothetical protein BDW42DRAFT_138295 [Aspergillus taichungensis]